MSWRKILDDRHIGQLFPGNDHNHILKNLSNIGEVIPGSCSEATYLTEEQCCCQGTNECDDWDPIEGTCSNDDEIWTYASPDYSGGIDNAYGDILQLYPTLNANDYTNRLVFLDQHPVDTWSGVWKLADAISDTNGAKKLVGFVLTSGVTGANPKVLTSGYIAINSTMFETTGTALTPGQVIYMSTDSGKLTNIPPANSTNVVRVMGYITQLSSANSNNIIFNLKPDAVWIEVA